MRKNKSLILFLAVILISTLPSMAQLSEPDFIGEAYLLDNDNSYVKLDKEIGDFSSGISFSSNSWNALSLEINGGKADSRFSSSEPLQLVVRSVDNNSDPLSIIRIYKFKANKKKRTVAISKDNSGTLMKSRTMSKDQIRFSGEKYGESSYLITLKNLKEGEYGIITSNPNSVDEKSVIVSCFAIEK